MSLGIAPGFARANYAGHGVAEQLRDLSRWPPSSIGYRN